MSSPSGTPRPAPGPNPTRRQLARGSRSTIRAVTIVVPHNNGTVARANWWSDRYASAIAARLAQK